MRQLSAGGLSWGALQLWGSAASWHRVQQRKVVRCRILSRGRQAQSPCFTTTGIWPADTATYYGLAAPPSSYGAALTPKNASSKDIAKYSFDYPAGWKVDTVGKNEKGMQGIDGRVRNLKVKGQAAYVVTFGRAGEDNKAFKLGDVETTLQGFAGADYDLQDALTEAQQKSSGKRELDGQTFYDYELGGPAFTYLASITQKGGKVFALFVKSPSKNFSSDSSKLRNIMETFRTL